LPESVFVRIASVAIEEIARMWWFFLLSILLVGIIKGFRLDLRIRDAMNRQGVAGILFAVAVGMISPLCACGILPVVISLAMIGTPIAPLMALLATSPVMGPDAFILTYRGLGPEWAFLKLAGAAFIGLSTGFMTQILVAGGYFSGELVRLKPVYRQDGALASAYDIGCANGIAVRTMTIVPRESRLRFIFDRTADAGLFVGKFLLLAILLEAVIVTVVPIEWVTALAGQKNFSSVLLAAFVGIPLPTNQIPIIPILSGLLQRGMDDGAAFTLLMAGPVTSIPAIVALWGMFSKRVVLVYIFSSLLVCIALGWGFQLLK